ncbi:MAG: hypothetical protein ACK6DA_02040, partial [Candidatus Kapaibacterium sp.]
DGTVEELHVPDSLNLDTEQSTETTQNEQHETEIVDIAVNDIIAETIENAEQQTSTDAPHSDAAEATETASILPEDEEVVNSDERTVEPEHITDGTTHSESHTHAEVYSLQEQNARGYIPSLSSKIDPAKRDTFIKKVFHKDPELFDTFVKDIDKTYSWKEAAAAIDRFYVRHNIKDSGAVAKELRTIIQKRYVR